MGKKLFIRKGFNATTTRELAKAAGIGVGTFFLYFPRKQDLLLELHAQEVTRVTAEALARLPPRGMLLNRLMFLFGALYDYYGEEPHLARIFLKELLFLEPDESGSLGSLTLGLIEQLGELARQAREDGELHAEIHELEAAYQFYSAYYFGLITWLSGTVPTRAAQKAMLRRALELSLVGLIRRR